MNRSLKIVVAKSKNQTKSDLGVKITKLLKKPKEVTNKIIRFKPLNYMVKDYLEYISKSTFAKPSEYFKLGVQSRVCVRLRD